MSNVKGVTVTLIKNAKALEALYATMNTSRKGLETIMHQAACSALWHLGQHKDVRQVSKCLAAMHDEDGKTTALNTNACRAWFEAFGMVKFVDNKPVLDATKPMKLGEAMAKPFWVFKPQKDYVAVDVLAVLEALTKKLLADQSKTEGTDHQEIIAGIDRLKELAKAKDQARKAKALADEAVPAIKLSARKPAATPDLLTAAH